MTNEDKKRKKNNFGISGMRRALPAVGVERKPPRTVRRKTAKKLSTSTSNNTIIRREDSSFLGITTTTKFNTYLDDLFKWLMPEIKKHDIGAYALGDSADQKRYIKDVINIADAHYFIIRDKFIHILKTEQQNQLRLAQEEGSPVQSPIKLRSTSDSSGNSSSSGRQGARRKMRTN